MKKEYDFSDAEQGRFYRPLHELDILLRCGKRMESVRRHKLWQKHLDKDAFAKRVVSYAKDRLTK